MPELKMKQYRKLQSLGAEPIPRPSEINFGDNITLQQSPGRHHLDEFQDCGTYLHPNLIADRLRVAKHRLKRYDNMTASDTEMAKYKSSRDGLVETIKAEQKNMKSTIAGKSPIGKILKRGEGGYEYRIVGMDYSSIVEDFEEGTEEDHDINVLVQQPEVVDEEELERTDVDLPEIDEEPETVNEPDVIAKAAAAATAPKTSAFVSDSDED